MRMFWVKRGEWVIGPVTEHQIRAMARQQWFRSTDQIGIGQEGPWATARTVVPSRGFNAEQTPKREPVLEAVEPPASRKFGDAHRTSADAQLHPQIASSRPADTGLSAADARPAWFRGRKADRSRDSGEPADGSRRSVREGVSEHAPHSRRSAETSGSSLVDDLMGGAALLPDQSGERFPTAAFTSAAADDASDGNADLRSDFPVESGRPTRSGDWNFDLSAGLMSEDEQTKPRADASTPLPEQLELEDGCELQPKPVTDWELVIGDLDADEAADEGEAAPFALSVHNLKTGKMLSPAESAESAELDFARLAHLASADPALSRSELPIAPVEAEPVLMTSEERALRRTIGSEQFQGRLSFLCLTIGLQSCALSAIINGLGYVALRRFFLLSTEVFFPWGAGATEVLEGADLALAGTAMAITFALPFLALSYLIRVDGRVLFYLISLGAALIPAVVIGSGGLNSVAGASFACLLIAVPAIVAAVLSGLLAKRSADQPLRRLLATAAAAGVMVAASVAFAAPNFSIEYLLREMPPELRLSGGLLYVVLLFYSVQLSLLYFVVARVAKVCLDETTQRFVEQHMIFHWLLTMTAFVLTVVVHARVATGWGTAPVLLGGLTAVVALGFNLWSLVAHLEPRFDRLRVGD